MSCILQGYTARDVGILWARWQMKLGPGGQKCTDQCKEEVQIETCQWQMCHSYIEGRAAWHIKGRPDVWEGSLVHLRMAVSYPLVFFNIWTIM